MSGGIDEGYGDYTDSDDAELVQLLKYNIAEFSALKENSFREQLENALIQDGKLLSWNDFKKEADALNIQYNKNWLKTEYHHTVASANMANKWKQFERDADLYPNLKYHTAGDERVREQHRIWDGLVLPISHEFWKTHLPPNDWGCRCHVTQSDEDVSVAIPTGTIKAIFKNNPGESGKVFGEITYANGLSGNEIKKVLKFAKRMFSKAVLQLPRERQFITLYKSGNGRVRRHLLAPIKDDSVEIFNVSKELAKMGNIVEIMPEISAKDIKIRAILFPNLLSKTSNPDIKIDNDYFDLKRPSAVKNFTGNANDASKQGAIAIISDSRLNKKLESIVMDNRAKQILSIKNKAFYQFETVYFFIKGKIYRY